MAWVLAGTLILSSSLVIAEVATLRDMTPIEEQPAVEVITEYEQLGQLRNRAYPMQAPTIPHAITGFSITRDFNQCLVCHNTDMAPTMKAPSIGVSHYINREGQYIADVSPRRFFCTQCHVPQLLDEPQLVNTFKK
jgi:cytochrome c-type protein NapB